MRIFSKLLIVASAIIISGCSKSEQEPSSSSSQYVEYNYEMVADKFIELEDVFLVKDNSYYVYFFSRNCFHCMSIKDFMIQKILETDSIYLVEANSEINFTTDENAVINCDSQECLMILGYPTLLKITDNHVTKNLAGTKMIKEELSN